MKGGASILCFKFNMKEMAFFCIGPHVHVDWVFQIRPDAFFIEFNQWNVESYDIQMEDDWHKHLSSKKMLPNNMCNNWVVKHPETDTTEYPI